MFPFYVLIFFKKGDIFQRGTLFKEIRYFKVKKAMNAFFALKLSFMRQLVNHMGWATSMPFASINQFYMEINPWKFGLKEFTIQKFTYLITIQFLFSFKWKSGSIDGVHKDWGLPLKIWTVHVKSSKAETKSGPPRLARPARPGPCLDFGFKNTLIRNNRPKNLG